MLVYLLAVCLATTGCAQVDSVNYSAETANSSLAWFPEDLYDRILYLNRIPFEVEKVNPTYESKYGKYRDFFYRIVPLPRQIQRSWNYAFFAEKLDLKVARIGSPEESEVKKLKVTSYNLDGTLYRVGKKYERLWVIQFNDAGAPLSALQSLRSVTLPGSGQQVWTYRLSVPKTADITYYIAHAGDGLLLAAPSVETLERMLATNGTFPDQPRTDLVGMARGVFDAGRMHTASISALQYLTGLLNWLEKSGAEEKLITSAKELLMRSRKLAIESTWMEQGRAYERSRIEYHSPDTAERLFTRIHSIAPDREKRRWLEDTVIYTETIWIDR